MSQIKLFSSLLLSLITYFVLATIPQPIHSICGSFQFVNGQPTCQACAADGTCTPINGAIDCGNGICCSDNQCNITPAPTTSLPEETPFPTSATQCGLIGNQCCYYPLQECFNGLHCASVPGTNIKFCLEGSPTPDPSGLPTPVSCPVDLQSQGYCNTAANTCPDNSYCKPGITTLGCNGVCTPCEDDQCPEWNSGQNPGPGIGSGLPAFSICKYVDCPCDGDPQEGGGIPTALGCVPTDATAFISRLAVFALSLAGGIAFLLMLYGVLVVATAAGNPERYSAGIQTATSALAGLLAIIFSATALQIIGIEIISLPGF